jgi:hypothetical protein
MALIQCYDCEKEISDQAARCPHCAAPKEEQPPQAEEVEILESVAVEDEPETVAQEPVLADYTKGRREDVKWVWREGPIERERILERLKDAESEKKEKSTD